MKPTLVLLFVALIVVQGSILDTPFTYCIAQGDLCCDGYSREIQCPSSSSPGFGNCCAGAVLLVSRTVTTRLDVKPLMPQLEISGTVTPPTNLFTALYSANAPVPFPSPPHLSSVVLRI